MVHARAAGQRDAVSAERAHAAETATKRKLQRRHGKAVLSELERRELWLGSKRQFDGPEPDLANLSAAGRAFLRSIRQEPDWSLIVDKRGNVTGRRDDPAAG